MKSLVDLLALVLEENGTRCGVATNRDVETLRFRVEHEGESFVTILLAEYCRDLDRALAAGRVTPDLWPNFGKAKAGYPSFGKGFLCRVFDSKSGDLLLRPSIDCIRSLRQISRFGVKVLLECTQARKEAAVAAYEETEVTCVGLRTDPEECAECAADYGSDRSCCAPPDLGPAILTARWGASLGHYYNGVASTLVGALSLEDEDGNIPVRCVHGPGATVEGYTPNGKWASRDWHERLEQSGYTWLLARLGAEKTLWGAERVELVPTYVDPADERPSKVVLVPKTLKSPRVIAVEPACMQYAQQGLAHVLRTAIDHCRYTSGRVNFSDQRVNQGMAILGSVDGSYATIDLKDASDRVDCDLVEHLFRAAPEKFRAFLWACRSMRARLPDGRVIALRKFASMGSAMCFPVEALVFFVITVASRLEAHGLPLTPDNVARCSQGVYVYGDDLCVPADEAPAVCRSLEAMGLKVNYHKSFWTGRFRESCGKDVYAGEDVTPTYLRRMPPADRADIPGIVSTVSTANQLFAAGCPKTASALKGCVERIVGKLPTVHVDSPALGWHWFSDYVPPTRWNRNLQRLEQRCWVPTAVERDDPLEGEGALVKCFRLIGTSWFPQGGNVPLSEVARSLTDWRSRRDSGHLLTSARPYALALKRRWLPLS